MTTRYLALLRGVNVGGANILPMKDLANLFTEAGSKNVATFIQSGNVVFDGSAKAGAVVCSKIEETFGFKTTIILRSLAEMEKIAASNPYPDVDHSHVVFLAVEPAPARIAQLDPNRSAPDQFTVAGREIYLHMPNGMGRTKLTNAWFDSKLKTVSTVRNWRTVLKLLAMMAG
jgi:uncharacterized protein (DUF1697 family)